MRKVATHSVYNTAQISQSAAMGALASGSDYLERARTHYQRAAAIVENQLQARFFPAQGGSFVFVDLRSHGPNALRVLERAADRGVTLAPGEIFGAGYQGYARFCYTAVDLETLSEGIAVLNEVLTA
jgi:aspartate/methionine/tyrosine aminotransferase